MDKDTTAYLTDIKRYEDILAKDPQSFCFAPLSDVYRKIGRLDDALEIALKGCEAHPGYIGGYMALGRACFEKGLHLESRQALEKVVDAMPGNLLAHKLLGEVCRILGDADAAAESEAVVRALTGEVEPERATEPPQEIALAVSSGAVEEEADIEWNGFDGEIETGYQQDKDEKKDDEIIELIDVVWDEDETNLSALSPRDEAGTVAAAAKANPLSTVTIAELYVSQGFTERALAIYQEILAADPENTDVQQRIDTLRRVIEEEKLGEIPSAEVDLYEGDFPPAEGNAPQVEWEAPSVVMATMMAAVPAEEVTPEKEKSAPDQAGVLETLEGWLENIRRRR